jgi:GntP family gluconate:H+ symporter
MLYIIVSIILIILSNLIIFKLSNTRNALLFFIFMAAALFCGLVTGINLQDLLSLLRRGFAESAANTGLIIIVCHLYAALLYKLGVYDVLASLILRVGKNRYPSLFLGIFGGIASVPASGESGYPMFSPLGRSISGKTGVSSAVTALSLASGIYVTHALIVPAYGPLVSSGIMNANLLLLFALGLFISVPGIFAADYFSRRYASKVELDLLPDMIYRGAPDNFSLRHTFAVFTIVFPITLMLLRAAGSIQSRPFGSGIVYRFIYFLGDPVISILSQTVSADSSYSCCCRLFCNCFQNNRYHESNSSIFAGMGRTLYPFPCRSTL